MTALAWHVVLSPDERELAALPWAHVALVGREDGARWWWQVTDQGGDVAATGTAADRAGAKAAVDGWLAAEQGTDGAPTEVHTFTVSVRVPLGTLCQYVGDALDHALEDASAVSWGSWEIGEAVPVSAAVPSQAS